MTQTERRTTDTVVHDIVRQRYMDQIDADEAAEVFLMEAALRCKAANAGPQELNLKWWNLENDEVRVGALYRKGYAVASVQVTRDDMNWSELTGLSFV